MVEQAPRGWRRHFLYRREVVRTTWKFRLLVVLVPCLVGWTTRDWWTLATAQSLVCHEQLATSDALLVENFDPSYLLFERAAALQAAGIAPRILTPVVASNDPNIPSPVSKGIAEVMARVARLPDVEVIPIQEIEPITLNAAEQIRRHLMADGRIKSIIVVAPDFRSRRSLLVYRTVLEKAQISVGCAPVFGATTPANWTDTWHGMQKVLLQLAKLQYYRFYVLL